MKFLVILMTFYLCLFAEEVKIEAQKFEADENKRVSIFSGNVHVKKGNDEINTSTLIITFDKENNPLSYEANGNLKFKISTKTQKLEGYAEYMIYEPKTQMYQIIGNAYIHEEITGRKLYGEKIIIDRLSGKSQIIGTEHKPVKIIFSTKE